MSYNIQAVIDAITESESTVLFSSAELLEKTGAKVSSTCSSLKHIIYSKHANPATPQRLDKINPEIELISYDDLCNGADTDSSFPDVVGTDLAVVMYTSGTTGKAKGVIILHQNLIAAVQGLASRLSLSGISFDANDCYIGSFIIYLAIINVGYLRRLFTIGSCS